MAIPGGGPIQIASFGSAGSTITSPLMGASPVGLNVGGGQAQKVYVANNGATGTQPSIGTLPGPVGIGTGGAPMQVVRGTPSQASASSDSQG